MNKQPFYHVAQVLFTGTRDFKREEFEQFLRERLKHEDIVPNSIDVEMIDAEPGDPANLL